MGRELDKNNYKLQKIQQSVQVSHIEYKAAVAALQETTSRWQLTWKEACDSFQDLEENRHDNVKTSLWTYANLLSQVCVTVDESCERLRLSLEKCNVHADIQLFLQTSMTGTEIPGAPELTDFRDSSEPRPHRPHRIANFPRPSCSPNAISSADLQAKENRKSISTISSPANDNLKNSINQYPLDGITQLCRSDSAATFHSMTHSIGGSVATSSSTYSSIPSSQKHTPNTSISSHRAPVPSRKKSLIETSNFAWPVRRSPSPSKLEIAKPLKAQKTGGSMFDALRPSRSRSRAGDRTDKTYGGDLPTTDPRSSEVLHVGTNMLPVAIREASSALVEQDKDPIAAALAKLQLTSRSKSPHKHGEQHHTTRHQPELGRPNNIDQTRRQGHRRIVSRSEPSSPVLSPEFHYIPHQHNSSTQSAYPESSRLGAPPAAHSAVEMRNTTDHYMSRSQTVFQTTVENELQFDRDHALIRKRSSGNQSEVHIRDRSPQHAPGNLRRSPSPSPSIFAGHGGHDSRPPERRPKSQATYNTSDHFLMKTEKSNNANDWQNQTYTGTQHAENHSRDARRQSTYTITDVAIPQTSRRRKSVSPNSTYGDPRYDPTRGRDPDQSSVASVYKPLNRTKSKSYVDLTKAGKEFTKDGRQILTYMVALYDYQATIPEEIGFCQGDTLAILEMREDGWWIGEALGSRANRRGLVPSNFFRKL